MDLHQKLVSSGFKVEALKMALISEHEIVIKEGFKVFHDKGVSLDCYFCLLLCIKQFLCSKCCLVCISNINKCPVLPGHSRHSYNDKIMSVLHEKFVNTCCHGYFPIDLSQFLQNYFSICIL